MKRKLINLLLCLALLISLASGAMAATLDTTDVTIQGNTIIIGSSQNAVLIALHSQGRTAKIAVPYTQEEAIYVLKDHTQIVAHNWEKTGYIQFEVPGAGTYEIRKGIPRSLDEQLQAGSQTVAVLQNKVLDADYTVADGTILYANGQQIRGGSGTKTLTAAGSLSVQNLEGAVDLFLGAGDKAAFDASGNITVTPAADHNAAGEAVGYGSVKVTSQINGKAVTQTYFLIPGETLSIQNGEVTGYNTFDPAGVDAKTPNYRLAYAEQDHVHWIDSENKIEAQCNGLYDYYTAITLTLQGTSQPKLLAAKVDGKDVYSVSGILIEEGSTVLTLMASYLDTLPAGVHTLTFQYKDGGAAQSVLHVYEATAKAEADTSNPKTGDSITLYGTVLLLTTLMGACLLRNKQTH